MRVKRRELTTGASNVEARLSPLRAGASRLTIIRAGAADYGAVMSLLREAADWLSARGNPQWIHWHSAFGEERLRENLERHEVYLAHRDGVPVGTLTIQWVDPEVWGERGVDGKAGYIHGIAIARRVGGMRVGERLLEWAVATIAERGRRFARLDAMESNRALCRYYERLGFRPLGTATLFAGNWTSRLFERDLQPAVQAGLCRKSDRRRCFVIAAGRPLSAPVYRLDSVNAE